MSAKTYWLSVIAVCLTLASGCRSDRKAHKLFEREPDCNYEILDSFRGASLPIEQPSGIPPEQYSHDYDIAPLDDFKFGQPGHFRLMALEECIHTSLQSSPVIRDLGGAILRSPDLVSTIQDPSIVYSDPQFGEEAALSAFDAQLNGQFIFQKNDRAYNNRFLGDNGFLQENLTTYRAGLSKLSATGALFQFNHVVDYNFNNSPSNRFNPPDPGSRQRSRSYDTFFEAGFRQPLFQGAGVEFNRIAGPNNAPGINNGILIARTNTDMDLAEFETQLRNLISNVENAYWDLYYAYRKLEARIEARNGAYKIWENAEANESGAAILNQAKEQYYRFAAEVENTIHGRLNEGTRTNNGSPGGTFRNTGGVRTAERRLRLITGLPLNDGQLIVPSDRPTDAEVVFDWYQSKTDALVYRPELRRQRWKLKRRELEQLASRNHLLPRIDFLGRYRVRGFGENLFGKTGFTGAPYEVDRGSSATASLLDGDLQEWELGFDVNVPIGFRQQHAAFKNAELLVAREKAILREQERHVIYDLSNAMGELKRAIRVRSANQKRLDAAEAEYESIKVVYQEEDSTINQLLDAQRRVIEAKTEYFQSQVENMLALRSVHFEKGTLFQYHSVLMTESAWSGEAQRQLMEREKWKTRNINYYFPGLQAGQKISGSESQANLLNADVIDFAQNNNDPDILAGQATPTSGSVISPLMAVADKVEQRDTKIKEIRAKAAHRLFPQSQQTSVADNRVQRLPTPNLASASEVASIQRPVAIPRGTNSVPIIQANQLIPVARAVSQPQRPSAGESPTNSPKATELVNAIERVTQKAKRLGDNMVNTNRSNPSLSIPPQTMPSNRGPVRVSDGGAALGPSSSRR